jgi:tetratricopeptide (TPR) repeat protein
MRIYLTLSIIILSTVLSPPVHGQSYPPFSWYRAKDTLTFKRAKEYYFNGNFKEALRTLNQLPSKLYGKNPGLLNLLADCHINLKEYLKAIENYSKILTYNPEYTIIYYERAHTFLELENYKAAASDFAAFTIHYPNNKNAAENLAYCLVMDNQIDAGIKYLENFEPKDTTTYIYIGNYYSDFKKNHKKAIENYNKALELDPTNTDVIEYISISYAQIESYQQAIISINKLIELNTDYGRAYYLRGIFEEQLGLDSEAQKSFNLAREKGYVWDEWIDEDEN